MSLIYKTVAGKASDSLTFVLSDATLDRMGDVIEPDGWDLKWFKRNPIALFNHNPNAPIGTWKNVRIENGKLMAELEPAQRGTSQRVDEILNLIDQNILRATSVGFRALEEPQPLNGKDRFSGVRFTKQELLETSIVSVPANPAALQVAKSLNISEATRALAFDENVEEPRPIVVNKSIGEQAAIQRVRAQIDPEYKRANVMKTLSQLIEDGQKEVNTIKDQLNELLHADAPDLEAADALTEQLETVERLLHARKAYEMKLGLAASGQTDDIINDASGDVVNKGVQSPAVITERRPLGMPSRELKGLDLLVRAVVVRGCSHFGNKTIDQVLDERYPGHQPTAYLAKADQTVGTTTVSGWASELVQTTYSSFMDALNGLSVYPALRANGIGLSFDGNGTVSIPSRTAGGAGGGFVAEGAPIRVGRITTAATTMTARKLGVIVPFTRELAKRSTPAIEGLVRQAILEDTSVVLDAALLDATASSTARPAGLLNGVSAVATGFGGGDAEAVIRDFQTLLAPFYAANAADNITILMNPAQGFALSMMPGPGVASGFNWSAPLLSRLRIIESTHVTAGRLIALRNSDFATALGDAPEFDVSEQATVHMEDTTPLEIVSGTGPTTADPVRSFFQTATIGVRMIMDVGWMMRRTGMVQWIDGTTW